MSVFEELSELADNVEASAGGCGGCIARGEDGSCKCEDSFDCTDAICAEVSDMLREIVERDECEATTVSAYDLLSDDDREALAWVRERGGLDHVKSEWRSRVHRDRYERMRQSLLRHIAECETALGRRMRRISELTHRVSDLTTENAELRKRAMPEGHEWPRYESGEMVQIGDDVAGRFSGNPIKVRSIEFRDGDTFLREGCKTDSTILVYPGERVKRPAPKVLDADGVEIREGDVLYSIETGDYVTVGSIEPGNPWFATTDGTLQHCAKLTHRAPVLAADGEPLREGETVWKVKNGDGPYHVQEIRDGVSVCVEETSCEFMPKELTHERPVLDADGEPLEVGQTVWHVNNGMEFTVSRLPKPGEYQAVEVRYRNGSSTSFDPDQLTHQRPVLDADGVPIKKGDTVYVAPVAPFDDPMTVRGFSADGRVLMDYHSDDSFGYRPEYLTHAKPEPPDTWECIEDDATRMPGEYCERYGIYGDSFPQAEAMACDLVRRCRALAERGE